MKNVRFLELLDLAFMVINIFYLQTQMELRVSCRKYRTIDWFCERSFHTITDWNLLWLWNKLIVSVPQFSDKLICFIVFCVHVIKQLVRNPTNVTGNVFMIDYMYHSFWNAYGFVVNLEFISICFLIWFSIFKWRNFTILWHSIQ